MLFLEAKSKSAKISPHIFNYLSSYINFYHPEIVQTALFYFYINKLISYWKISFCYLHSQGHEAISWQSCKHYELIYCLANSFKKLFIHTIIDYASNLQQKWRIYDFPISEGKGFKQIRIILTSSYWCRFSSLHNSAAWIYMLPSNQISLLDCVSL